MLSSLDLWVENGWLRGRSADAEYQVRVRPHCEAWCKDELSPFWRHVNPGPLLKFPDAETAQEQIAIKKRERLRSSGQGHFPFDYLGTRQRFFPLDKNPDALNWLLSGLPRLTRRLQSDLCFPEETWHLLMYMDVFGLPAGELMLTNPVLGEILFLEHAHKLVQGVKEDWHREFRRDLHGRQRGLLHWCGIPDEERMVRVLGKMEPSMRWFSCEIGERLTKMCHMKVLGHLPRITEEVWTALQVECDHPGTLSPSFLLDLAEGSSGTARWFNYNFELLRRIEEITGIKQGPFDSPEKLECHFENLKRQAADLPLDADALIEIPVPVCEESEGIVPLRNNHDYLKEALEMRHCVMGQFQDALEGDVAHFRVTAPERATLKIMRNWEIARWTIAELRGPCNRIVSEETVSRLKGFVNQIDFLGKNRKLPVGAPSCGYDRDAPPF